MFCNKFCYFIFICHSLQLFLETKLMIILLIYSMVQRLQTEQIKVCQCDKPFGFAVGTSICAVSALIQLSLLHIAEAPFFPFFFLFILAFTFFNFLFLFTVRQCCCCLVPSLRELGFFLSPFGCKNSLDTPCSSYLLHRPCSLMCLMYLTAAVL